MLWQRSGQVCLNFARKLISKLSTDPAGTSLAHVERNTELSGKATADMCMVLEFAHTFKEVMAIGELLDCC